MDSIGASLNVGAEVEIFACIICNESLPRMSYSHAGVIKSALLSAAKTKCPVQVAESLGRWIKDIVRRGMLVSNLSKCDTCRDRRW